MQQSFDRTFFASLAGVITLMSVLYFWDLGRWPFGHDEVTFLAEIGVKPTEVVGAPVSQYDRIRKAVPFWYAAQARLLSAIPPTEFNARLLSALCAIATVAWVFSSSWRRRGPVFALSIAALVALSQPFIWLAQNDRFYMSAMLFWMITLELFWWEPARAWVGMAAVGVSTFAGVLSHNLLVVPICLCLPAACLAYWCGRVPRSAVYRTAVAATVCVVVYVFYLRPLVTGWISGGLGGTNALVSFVAMIGIPTIALATLGAATAVRPQAKPQEDVMWIGLLLGSLAFVGSWPLFLNNWNPGYAFLFFPPLWFLAARGVEAVARTIPDRLGLAGWCLCVLIMLMPKFASHFMDGSRHDMRASAAIAAAHVQTGDVVLANWPSELQYYLKTLNPAPVRGWWRGESLPPGSGVVVYGSNAFEPIMTAAGRRMEVLGEVFRRRFDEQSYVVRVYRFWPASN